MSVLSLTTPPDLMSTAEVVEQEPGDRDAFESLWLEQAPEGEDHELLRRVCAAEFSSWRLYTALDNHTPSAYGCLYVSHGAAVLASAHTRPESRGRGLQSALIARRVADAAPPAATSSSAPPSPNRRASATSTASASSSPTARRSGPESSAHLPS